MSNRREFIALLGCGAAWPLGACAQQPERMRRIGALFTLAESDPEVKAWLTAFQEGLQQLSRRTCPSSSRPSSSWFNLKAAKVGLEVPPTLLALADEVIE